MSYVDSTQSVLEAAMRGAMTRQTALTSNLANVNTPGYQREDVDFQSQLQSAMQSGQNVNSMNFQTQTDPQVVNGDGSGIDPDQESADLAENGLLYQSLAEVLSAQNSTLEYAMGTK